jgi:hypothetical protein
MQRRASKPRGKVRGRQATTSGGRRAAAPARERAPQPAIDELQGRRWRWDDPESLFSGPRPEVCLAGLEPAFLLFDSQVMAAVRTRAAERGMAYDTLVRMIVREHVDEY